MREYLSKAIDVEMQRFGLFFTLMIASGGGSVGVMLGEFSVFKGFLAIAGVLTAFTSAGLALRSYIKINKLLEELRGV